MSSYSLPLLEGNSARSNPSSKTPESQTVPPTRGLVNEFIQQLPALPGTMPAWLLPALKSLQNEQDETLLLAGLVHVGIQLRSEDHLEGAQVILGRLTQGDIPAETRQKAEAEISAMMGKGHSGMRAEFLLSRFSKDATDWRMILPMLGGAMVGEMVGTAALGRLTGSAIQDSASWITKGLGARLAAGTAGYLAEVSTFAGLGHALSPIPNGRFSDQFARAALTLGALRASGWVGKNLGALGIVRSQGLPLQGIVTQTSALLGLMLSHKMEERLGLRPRVNGETFFLDSVASLFSLGVGAHLGRGALGQGFADYQNELGLRSRILDKAAQNNGARPVSNSLALAGAGNAPGGRAVESRNPPMTPIMMMAELGGGSGGDSGGGKRGGSPAHSLPQPEGGTRWVDGSRPSQIKQRELAAESIPPEEVLEVSDLEPMDESPPPVAQPNDPSPPPPASGPSDPYQANIGKIIDGRYKVEAVLGYGGMGVVYRCTHQGIGKKVAMKVLRSEMSQDQEVLERFRNEAQAATTIGNPHIIETTDFGNLPDGSSYFVMEFLQGEPLIKLVENGQYLPVPRLLNIGRQLAEGLAAAHKANIVHRDLKPENVFIVNQGSVTDFVKVLDFGIAKFSTNGKSRLTRAGAVFGTPQYMSPEQAQGVPVDHRGDIYSFGVMLYEMATGKLPFDDENVMSILTHHMYKEPLSMRTMVSNPEQIPPELDAIVLKCLSKKKEDRYQSMEEVIADIEKLQNGLVPDALPEMNARSRPRWPIYAGISGIGVAAVAGAAIFAASRLSNSSTGPTSPVPQKPDGAPTPATAPTATLPTLVNKKQVALKMEPADAHAFQDGKDLGTSEVLVEIPEGSTVNLEIRREGYITENLTLDGSQIKPAIRLKREPAGKYPKARPSATPPVSSAIKPKPKGSSEVISPWK